MKQKVAQIIVPISIFLICWNREGNSIWYVWFVMKAILIRIDFYGLLLPCLVHSRASKNYSYSAQFRILIPLISHANSFSLYFPIPTRFEPNLLWGNEHIGIEGYVFHSQHDIIHRKMRVLDEHRRIGRRRGGGKWYINFVNRKLSPIATWFLTTRLQL